MRSLLIFFGVLSTLVVVHEWGHFIVARMFGIAVHRFSIGFGPVLLKRKFRGTEFCLSLVPFGGYVKLAGEEPGEVTGSPDEFNSRPAYQKAAVICAGPFLNALLAFFLFTGIFLLGQPAFSTTVGQVMDGYPAQKAGLKEGDKILSVNGKAVHLWEDLLIALAENREDTIAMDIAREGTPLRIVLSPRIEEAQTLLGKRRQVGRIGVMPKAEIVYVKSSLLDSVKLGFLKVTGLSKLILQSLAMIFTGQLSFKESMTGPIGIYFMTQQAAQIGFVYLLHFTAALSVSLFVLNLLPIPVLDGGHLLFIVLESIIRRPISDKVKERSIQVGLYFFIALAVLVIYQDSVKYGIIDKLRSIVGL